MVVSQKPSICLLLFFIIENRTFVSVIVVDLCSVCLHCKPSPKPSHSLVWKIKILSSEKCLLSLERVRDSLLCV